MRSKFFVTISMLVVAAALTIAVVAQSKQGPISPRPIPQNTALGCMTFSKDFNQWVAVTNTTNNTLKKGTKVFFTVNKESQSYVLANDLAAHARVDVPALSYTTPASCQAWLPNYGGITLGH